ncbi:MAG TPA: glycosyltransferase family 4 protein [Armatimonadota bacterium]|mgnify:FL=1|nr:glycosyltransferase family 4 protein [Armatimonadota bacterium]
MGKGLGARAGREAPFSPDASPTAGRGHDAVGPSRAPSILLVNHVSLVSGAERSLLGLARRLPDEGFSIEAALPPGGPLCDELAALGIPVYPVRLARLKRRTSPLRHLHAGIRLGASAHSLARLARRREIAIVHANSTTAALAALIAARRARLPGIWHVRDLVPLGGLGRWLGRLATRVIAISSAVADQVASWGVARERIVTLPNGIDPEAFRPDEDARMRLRSELGIPPEAFVVAAVGQIVPWKSHHVLLDAVGRLRRAPEGVEIRCLIAGADLFGDHPDYEALLRARAMQPDLRGAVTFLGHRTDVTAVYNACDAFALPSRREPFGRALVEAMACGKPCIACNEAGPAEIVADGETGLLVPPGDAGALAVAIDRLRRDAALAACLGEAGRARALAEYTEATTAARTASLYRELLGMEEEGA